jgi:hypothetical protein
MRVLIEEASHPLIGLSLWTSRRAADLQGFHFGEQRTVVDRSGEESVVGTFALHVQCAWRIRDKDRILVGSGDLSIAAGNDPDLDPDFDWDHQGANRRDERIADLFSPDADTRFVVRAVEADEVGGIRIAFGDDLVLEVFPNNTYTDEYWRLFQPSTEADHFVVTPNGIEE